MSWMFEHWDNGKVYLHRDRWQEFVDELMTNGKIPHTWNHTRYLIQLISPRDKLKDIPVWGNPYRAHTLNKLCGEFKVIYEPYPAFVRTDHDPEGWAESWNIFAETGSDIKVNRADPESLFIYRTVDVWPEETAISGLETYNFFAKYRNKYWSVTNQQDLGVGPNPPVSPGKKQKFRSVFDDYDPAE